MSGYEDFGELERRGWADADTAVAYADGFAAAAAQCVPSFVAGARAGPGVRALDVCCGHGIVARGLAHAGADVTGLDFSPAMISLARRRAPDIAFVEGDAMALDFADRTFDAVTNGFGMPHIPDAGRSLREARRVLRTGGRIVLSAWHGAERSLAFGAVFGAIEAHGHPSVVLPPAPSPHFFACPETAFPALETAGFRDPRLVTVDSYWESGDAGAPFDLFRAGTVRGAALLRSQPPDNSRAIRAAVVEAVKRALGPTGPWRIPIPAAIVSATA